MGAAPTGERRDAADAVPGERRLDPRRRGRGPSEILTLFRGLTPTLGSLGLSPPALDPSSLDGGSLYLGESAQLLEEPADPGLRLGEPRAHGRPQLDQAV